MHSVKAPRKDIKRSVCVSLGSYLCFKNATVMFIEKNHPKSAIITLRTPQRAIIRAREELLDQADSRVTVLTVQT